MMLRPAQASFQSCAQLPHRTLLCGIQWFIQFCVRAGRKPSKCFCMRRAGIMGVGQSKCAACCGDKDEAGWGILIPCVVQVVIM